MHHQASKMVRKCDLHMQYLSKSSIIKLNKEMNTEYTKYKHLNIGSPNVWHRNITVFMMTTLVIVLPELIRMRALSIAISLSVMLSA